MSIDTDPALYPFGTFPNVCPLCYDVGKSPASIFMSLNGIIKTAVAAPGDPPAPNGLFELPVTAPCFWSVTIGGISFSYGVAGGQTNILVNKGALIMFTNPIPSPVCDRQVLNFYNNQFLDPYIKGWCYITVPTPSDADSLPAILDLVGFDQAPASYANPRPTADNLDSYTLSRRSDATRLLIQIDAP